VKRVAVLAVLLLAGPSAGGDLIRYRAADGTIGLLDHPSKLPPGATVLQLSKPTQGAPSSDAGATPAPNAAPARFAEEPASAEADDGRAIGWCNRGRAAEGRVERAEERLAQAEEWYDRCDDGGIANYCSRSSLEAAEREVESAQEALADLEQDCRRSGCDPGWLRCGP